MTTDILTDVTNGVGTITFNRPQKKNALTGEMFAGFNTILRGWMYDDAVRVVVVTGSGDSFCAGADLLATPDPDSDLPQPQSGIESMRFVHSGAVTLHEFPKPVIAKVNGVAVGAGMNLALGADIVMMADTARFSEIFVKRGLSLDWGGSWVLPRVVGLHKAKELAFTGRMVFAEEAHEMGLANHVVPAAELDARVAELAAEIAAGPPIAIGQTKKLLNESHSRTMAQALDAESAAQAVNFGTHDTVEARKAFAEKRLPTFEGR